MFNTLLLIQRRSCNFFGVISANLSVVLYFSENAFVKITPSDVILHFKFEMGDRGDLITIYMIPKGDDDGGTHLLKLRSIGRAHGHELGGE